MAARKPVVVHVVEAFGGGVFHSVAQLCQNLSDDYDFIILHGLRDQTPADYTAFFPAGTRFARLEGGRAINPWQDFATTRILRRLVKNIIADTPVCAIHAHSSKAGAWVRLGCQRLGVPLFYSPRGYGFLMHDSGLPKRAFYAVAEFLLGCLPCTTVACGYDELATARWVSLRHKAVPNCIRVEDVPITHRTRPPFTGHLTVVSSGRITPQKNFPHFLHVARHFVGKPVAFIWVGGGATPLPDLPANTTVTGWLAHADGLQQLHRGHVFMLLSGWEGLSRTVLEAMSFGFPLILSNVAGNRELASAGNGTLCNTPQDAIAAIQSLLDNPAELARQGEASFTHVSRHYNWQHIAAMWKGIYGPQPLSGRRQEA